MLLRLAKTVAAYLGIVEIQASWYPITERIGLRVPLVNKQLLLFAIDSCWIR